MLSEKDSDLQKHLLETGIGVEENNIGKLLHLILSTDGTGDMLLVEVPQIDVFALRKVLQ